MKKAAQLVLIVLMLIISGKYISANERIIKDTLSFKGQLSTWLLLNENRTLDLWAGGRYLPQMNYGLNLNKNRLLDFEASANLNGFIGKSIEDSSSYDGAIKPYRIWGRYSSNQFEVRVGLQKINFGSASMLRPLMWFDQIDPADPLRFTDGVWGILVRYYFLNNANIWLWTLYGNKNTKGWEILATDKQSPEIGGRFQYPVTKGEVAVSYNYRKTDNELNGMPTWYFDNIPEHKIGFDMKFDLIIGCWFEAAWVNMRKYTGSLTNQEMLNLGFDYTFGIGNGVTLVYEQLLFAFDTEPFQFKKPVHFSLLQLSYPIGIFDNISAMIYYDFRTNKTYNFLSWQKTFDKISLYLIGYLNPEEYNIPAYGGKNNLYAGKGIQFMFVYNH